MNPTPAGNTRNRQFISPKHLKIRRALRTAGPVVLVIGILFTATAFISFLTAMNSGEWPRLFWCAFIGLPLMSVGAMLCMFGFMGAFSRYAAAEQAPVAAGTLNYLADHTQEGVKTVSRAVAQGVAEGLREVQSQRPPSIK